MEAPAMTAIPHPFDSHVIRDAVARAKATETRFLETQAAWLAASEERKYAARVLAESLGFRVVGATWDGPGDVLRLPDDAFEAIIAAGGKPGRWYPSCDGHSERRHVLMGIRGVQVVAYQTRERGAE